VIHTHIQLFEAYIYIDIGIFIGRSAAKASRFNADRSGNKLSSSQCLQLGALGLNLACFKYLIFLCGVEFSTEPLGWNSNKNFAGKRPQTVWGGVGSQCIRYNNRSYGTGTDQVRHYSRTS